MSRNDPDQNPDDEANLPAWACPTCFGYGITGSYGPITYTLEDGTVVTSEGFTDYTCSVCSGTGCLNGRCPEY